MCCISAPAWSLGRKWRLVSSHFLGSSVSVFSELSSSVDALVRRGRDFKKLSCDGIYSPKILTSSRSLLSHGKLRLNFFWGGEWWCDLFPRLVAEGGKKSSVTAAFKVRGTWKKKKVGSVVFLSCWTSAGQNRTDLPQSLLHRNVLSAPPPAQPGYSGEGHRTFKQGFPYGLRSRGPGLNYTDTIL